MKYRAILTSTAARIEPYEPRRDPTVTGYPNIPAAVRALGCYSQPVELPDGRKIIPLTVNYPYAKINATAGHTGRNGANIMKIYFVEAQDYNTLVAVEKGKAKTLDNDTGIDLEQHDVEGTIQTEKIVAALKQHFETTPLNDYSDIYNCDAQGNNVEYKWNPDDYDSITRVYQSAK